MVKPGTMEMETETEIMRNGNANSPGPQCRTVAPGTSALEVAVPVVVTFA